MFPKGRLSHEQNRVTLGTMRKKHTLHTILTTFFLCLISVLFSLVPCFDAAATAEEFQQQAEARKLSPVLSDSWEKWPKGPVNGSAGSVLMDIDTGAVLYAKKPEEKAYPASITKLMTALLVYENCAMDEMVSFSHSAVYSIERGSSNVGIDEGQSMTVQECLYCLMLASANEVANALAEHVGGSVEGFADMMNEKAAALGCVNTHFVNPNGLHDDDHYTCAGDMGLIARAFARNSELLEISGTISYTVEATATQPDTFTISNHHRMLKGSLYGQKYSYDYAIGGKTGFTVMSRETLVTFAEKEDMRLLAVVLREEPYNHYSDTKELFEYGFENFERVSLSELKENTLTAAGIQQGQSLEEGYATLPKSLELTDCNMGVSESGRFVVSQNGRVLGSAGITQPVVEEAPLPIKELETAEPAEGQKDGKDGEKDPKEEKQGSGISVKTIVIVSVIIGILAVLAGFVLYEIHRAQEAEYRKKELQERRRRRQERWEREDQGEVFEEYEEDDTFDGIVGM